MAEIFDFPCALRHDSCITPEVAEALSLRFPDAYCRADCLYAAAKYIRVQDELDYCHLPMCHTLEGDAMGAAINYGDERFGPRAGAFRYDRPEQLLKLPDMDFQTGHMAQVLETCRRLAADGEAIMYDVDGPFTILGTLIDMKHLFKIFRSREDLVAHIYQHLERNLLAYLQQLCDHGVTLFSYADSAGSPGILGPKLAERVHREFTVPFLKKAAALLEGRGLLVLCPKTSYALESIGLARWESLELGKTMSYQEAMLDCVGKTAILGESCVKNRKHMLPDGRVRTLCLI